MGKGRIPQRDVDAIRERTPIEEIVGDYVQLKPGGTDSLKGLSPFTDEKTPSFHVRPQRGYYHCFSTGKGGDVFNFLMEMEQITFPEAVEYCADKIGYHISYEGGGPGRREEPGTRRRLLEANRVAHEFYRARLETQEAAPARELLLDRGFSRAQIYEFECGYAPGGWDTLTKELLRKGFSFEELKAAGLSKMGRRGPIDQFQRRLLWPMKNMAGDVIGFGARKLFDDDNLGKYMNTPDTMLYHKSKVLFGIDQAKKYIAESHQAVVVEGYTDVMAMHAAGVRTAIAACGTAFGEEHLSLLRRLMLDDSFFRGEIIYTFDGDEAGRKAALRAFAGNQRFSGQSFVAIAPGGQDPCELRQASGDAALRDLVASRIPLFEFVIRTLIDSYRIDSLEGKLSALRRTLPIVADIRDEVLRSGYARKLAGWLGLDPDEVLDQVRRAARAPKKESQRRARRFDDAASRPVRAPETPRPDSDSRQLWPQREALKLGLQYPELAGEYFDGVDEAAYSDPAYRAVRRAMREAGGVATAADGVDWISRVAERMTDRAGRALVAELAAEDIRTAAGEDLKGYVDSVLSRLQEVRVGEQIATLKSQFQRMRPSDDEDAYHAMFADLMALESARKDLLDRAFNRAEP